MIYSCLIFEGTHVICMCQIRSINFPGAVTIHLSSVDVRSYLCIQNKDISNGAMRHLMVEDIYLVYYNIHTHLRRNMDICRITSNGATTAKTAAQLSGSVGVR